MSNRNEPARVRGKNRPPSWLIMPADKAARKIVAGITARKRRKVITMHGKFIVAMSRFFPGLLAWTLKAVRTYTWEMIQTAVISFMMGTVLAGKPGAMAPVKQGDTVKSGETIQTGDASVAILTLEDQSHVKLNAKSEMTLESGTKAGDEVVHLNSGGAFSDVTKKAAPHFFVKTRSATMGVRGTRFFTAYGENESAASQRARCVDVRAGRAGRRGDAQGKISSPGSRGEKESLSLPGKDVTPPKPYGWTKGLNWNMDPEKGDVVDHTSMKSIYHDLTKQNYD